MRNYRARIGRSIINHEEEGMNIICYLVLLCFAICAAILGSYIISNVFASIALFISVLWKHASNPKYKYNPAHEWEFREIWEINMFWVWFFLCALVAGLILLGVAHAMNYFDNLYTTLMIHCQYAH